MTQILKPMRLIQITMKRILKLLTKHFLKQKQKLIQKHKLKLFPMQKQLTKLKLDQVTHFGLKFL